MKQRKTKQGASTGTASSIGEARRKNIKKMKQRRRRVVQIQIGLFVCCVLLLLSVPYFMLRYQLSRYPKGKIYDNVFIGTTDVSDLTKNQAVKLLEENLDKDRETSVTMKVEKKEAEASLDELGVGYKDAEKVVEQAFDYGKKGNVFSRYRKVRKLRKEKYVVEPGYVLDEKTAEKTINEKAVPLADHAQDAAVIRTETGFSIIKEESGETIDIDKSVKTIEEKLNGEWDHKAFQVKMVSKKENPEITAEDLETISDEMGTFSTDAGGGERIQNLKTGSSKINGLVVMPGEEVSVHDVTAPYDQEHGYVAAGSYENGQVVETYGGGICQVSTTLYNALLYAEIEITERYPHSMLVNYVDPSRDAAIAGDVKDLKFKNNYETPIYIEGKIDDDNQLTFTVYGKDTRKSGRTVEFESETTSTEEPGKTYKADDSAPLGSIEYEGSPHTGKTAKLWKIVKQDGEEVSREVVNESTYQKSDEILVVGTASDNDSASRLVEDAVATQDADKINAAISKAQGME